MHSSFIVSFGIPVKVCLIAVDRFGRSKCSRIIWLYRDFQRDAEAHIIGYDFKGLMRLKVFVYSLLVRDKSFMSRFNR